MEAAPEAARGFVSTLGWTAPDKLLWRRVAIAGCAAHRTDCGEHLSRALEDADPMLRARALRAAGEMARRDLLPVLHRQMSSEVPACGFWAAWSAVLLGDRGDDLSALQSGAGSATPLGPHALQVVLHSLPPASGGGRRLAAGVGTVSRTPERPRHRLWGQR